MPITQDNETLEAADSHASENSSHDSQLQGQDTPSPEPEYPNSHHSEGSQSNHSSLTLSPADSPLRGIQSTGSLEIDSAASDEDLNPNEEDAASSAGKGDQQTDSDACNEDEDADISIANGSHKSGSESEDEESEDLQEGHAQQVQQARGSSSQREAQTPEVPCSSHASSQQDSETDSGAESIGHGVKAYPVDPTPDTQPGTPASQALSVGNSSKQMNSPCSHISLPTAQPAAAAVEDPWDAASSDGKHSQDLSVVQTAKSAEHPAQSSGEPTKLQSVTQKPRRRSLTYGIIRGADRAEEEVSEKATTSSSRQDKTPDASTELVTPMKSMTLSEGNSALSRQRSLHTQVSLHNGDSGHLTFSYSNSKTLSPTEDETKTILSGLRSQASHSDSEAGDWVGEVVSSLKPENGSCKRPAKS